MNPNLKGLSLDVPSDFGQRQRFDVLAAIAASVAAGGTVNTVSVCDNALKLALDECDQLVGVADWIIDGGPALSAFADSVDGGTAATSSFATTADGGGA